MGAPPRPSFDRHQYDGAIATAAGHGYVAATVDYRPSSLESNEGTKYPYPAQLIDVRSAVRWLRTHAARYDIDPSQFGAIGWSSGGHLAMMLALIDPGTSLAGEHDAPPRFKQGAERGEHRRVTDMALDYLEASAPDMQHVITDLIGGTPEQLPDAYRAASPLYHATKNAPPILLIQGDTDREVPLDQAIMLHDRLKALGAYSKLLTLEFTGHVNDYSNPVIFPFFDAVRKVHLPGIARMRLASNEFLTRLQEG